MPVPPPEVEDVAAAAAVIVKEFASILVIINSVFRLVAVIPPTATAPENVT